MFYIALYPVRWTAQSALHFPPLADLFIPTPFSASLGSIHDDNVMEHDDNESWWLAEDVKGQVGYVPAACLMIILDETLHEEESRKEGHDKRPDGTKIGGEMGQNGERRKTYSAAVIDGYKRTSTIYVGYSIVRKTDTRLCKGKDVVVCLPGARI